MPICSVRFASVQTLISYQRMVVYNIDVSSRKQISNLQSLSDLSGYDGHQMISPTLTLMYYVYLWLLY